MLLLLLLLWLDQVNDDAVEIAGDLPLHRGGKFIHSFITINYIKLVSFIQCGWMDEWMDAWMHGCMDGFRVSVKSRSRRNHQFKWAIKAPPLNDWYICVGVGVGGHNWVTWLISPAPITPSTPPISWFHLTVTVTVASAICRVVYNLFIENMNFYKNCGFFWGVTVTIASAI